MFKFFKRKPKLDLLGRPLSKDGQMAWDGIRWQVASLLIPPPPTNVRPAPLFSLTAPSPARASLPIKPKSSPDDDLLALWAVTYLAEQSASVPPPTAVEPSPQPWGHAPTMSEASLINERGRLSYSDSRATELDAELRRRRDAERQAEQDRLDRQAEQERKDRQNQEQREREEQDRRQRANR